MAKERDIHQHVEAAEASDRVLEKARLLDEKLDRVNADAEEQRKLFPPAPIKVKATPK